VTIADINQDFLSQGQKTFGFKTACIKENGPLPFQDNSFDIVYCNSVIEHVAAEKSQAWGPVGEAEFSKAAFERQLAFAKEIRRIGKKYFVQTPNKHFIIESHTWLPLVQFLPRPLLIKTIRFLNKWWVKKTSPDWNLLTVKQMKELFPDAIILREKSFGFTKSIIALRDETY
jgi:SAM-dependent methyltransferase